MNLRPAAVAVVLAALPLGAAAQGTNISLGPLQHDTSLPVEVTADNLRVENDSGVATFEGQVVVVQGDMRLAAEKIRVSYRSDGSEGRSDITEMQATGGVTFTNGADSAESQEAVYRPDDGNLVMTGDVVLTQGPSIISGQRFVADLDTGTGVMEGRVRTIFQSDDN